MKRVFMLVVIGVLCMVFMLGCRVSIRFDEGSKLGLGSEGVVLESGVGDEYGNEDIDSKTGATLGMTDSSEEELQAEGERDSLDMLGQMVGEFVDKVEEVVKGSSDLMSRAEYRELKLELESLEDEIDLFEDDVEFAYKTQQISKDDYSDISLALEILEEQLDRAEDQLERWFEK